MAERAAQGDRNNSVIVRWGVWGVIAVCGKNPTGEGKSEAVSNAPVTAANPVTDVQAPDTQGIITQQAGKANLDVPGTENRGEKGGKHYIW